MRGSCVTASAGWAGWAVGAGTRRLWLIVASWLCALPGCQTEPPSAPPDPPIVEPITLRWIRPAPGDSVAGRVVLRAEAEGGGGVRRMIFFADGIPLDSLAAPPWECTWSAQRAEVVERVSLRVDAWDEFGFRFRSPDLIVWHVPDRSPVTDVRRLEAVGAVPRSEIEQLDAYGCDAEDGPLPPTRIEWEVEGIPGRLADAVFDVERLGPWPQRVRTWVTDRRGQPGVSPWLTIFEYRDDDTAVGLFADFAHAFAAGDVARLLERLGDDFRFYPCGDTGAWDAPLFAERTASWQRAGHRPLRWSWNPRPVGTDAGGWFLADIVTAQHMRVPADECADRAPVLIGRFSASVQISTGPDGRDLRIRRWVDRSGPGPESTSLTELLLGARATSQLETPARACRGSPREWPPKSASATMRNDSATM